MATKKNDNDTNTRTTTDDAVNTDTNGVVNKSENQSVKDDARKQAEIVHRISATNPSETIETDIMTQVTMASDEDARVTAFKHAQEFIHALDQRIIDKQNRVKRLVQQHNDEEEVEGHKAIREMMQVAECFLLPDGTFDMKALEVFLKRQTGKDPNAIGVENEWQPLAKFCSYEKTAPGLVTKRAYVLHAAFADGVHSDQILSKLSKEGEEEVDGRMKRGINKYVLKYHLRRLNEMAPEKQQEEFIKKKFKGWEREQYHMAAQHFLDELYNYGLLRENVDVTKIIISD